MAAMLWEPPESTGSEYLSSMTPESQDFYLRMDHHRRRSGYRLGRIIARQQLLKRIAGGRCVEVTAAYSLIFLGILSHVLESES